MCIIIIIFHIYRFFPVYSADLWVSFFSFALITIFFDRLDKLFFFLFFFKFFPFFFSLYDIGLYFLLYIYVLLPLLYYSFLSPMCSTQSVRLSKDTNGAYYYYPPLRSILNTFDSSTLKRHWWHDAGKGESFDISKADPLVFSLSSWLPNSKNWKS